MSSRRHQVDLVPTEVVERHEVIRRAAAPVFDDYRPPFVQDARVLGRQAEAEWVEVAEPHTQMLLAQQQYEEQRRRHRQLGLALMALPVLAGVVAVTALSPLLAVVILLAVCLGMVLVVAARSQHQVSVRVPKKAWCPPWERCSPEAPGCAVHRRRYG